MNRLPVWIPLSIFWLFMAFAAKGQCVCTDCRCSDSLELVKLYNSTNGANWTNKWILTQPMTSWYGVTLANGRVTCIDLDGDANCDDRGNTGNNLVGTIPNFNLPNLQAFCFCNNQLSGSIPNFNLPNLQHLGLAYNQLSGNVPNFNLPNLQGLYLFNNQLSGSIPNFNLPNLQRLWLAGNELSGRIPDFNLPNLSYLELTRNQLSGDLPTFQNLPKLSFFYLGSNNLSGCYPTQWQRFCMFQSIQNYIDSTYNVKDNPKLAWQGDFQRFCNNEPQIGASCNDSLSNTINDKIQADCTCKGTLVVDINSCRYKDSLSLVDFYRATNMQNATPQYRWVLNQPMTTWKGVGLNANGCVECLDLDGDATDCGSWSENPPGVGLSGVFPTAIGRLTNLYRLHLRGNRGLTGQMPDSIRYLTNLAALYIDSCGLSGPLPNGFQDLVNLEDFTGYKTLFNTPIPNIFSRIKKMDSFDFNDTQTSGTLPVSLANVDSLRRLYLARNKMTGTVPIELANRFLHRLDLSDNDFDSLPKLNLVKWETTFVGEPYVHLQGNRFTFDDIVPNIKSLPPSFAKIYQPQDDIFTETTYTKSVGDPLSINLKIDAALTSNSYKWFKNGAPFRTPTNSNTLVFNNLQATDAGVYTCEVTNPNAPQLTLYSRKITIVVQPNTSCRYQDSLILVKFFQSTNGANWRVRNVNGHKSPWVLTEPMNNWLGVFFNPQGCIAQISLYDNNLSGTLPIELGNLSNLNYLGLSSNQIGGTIPASLGNLTNLAHLDLSFNQFDSFIPPSLGNLRQMQYMYLGANLLRGGIPPSLGNMTQIIELMLNVNQLSGSIPTELGNLVNVKKLLLSENNLTGTVPTSLGNLLQVKSLQFSKNQLTGAIPPSFRNLTNLVCLGFNDNFIDSVPNLSHINSLDTGCLQSEVNRLTFDDILPNLRANPRFSYTYNQQDSIFQNITYAKNVGETLTIDLGIDKGVTSNKYTWFKNGIYFDSSHQNTLILRGLSTCDAGTYTCEVTNPNAPLLTLKSRNIKLIVNGLLPSSRLDTTLCYGQNYRLPNNQIVNITTNFRDTVKNSRRCDSLIRLINVTFTPKPDSIVQNATICSGQNYTLPNGQIVAPLATTSYRDTLKTTGCDSRYRITNVTVNTKTVAQIIGLNPLYCRENVLVNLHGAPTGGIFKIDATTASNFTPSVLSVGNHTISYIYRAVNACSDTVNQTIRVADFARNTINRTICTGESITIDGKVYNQSRRTGIDTLKNGSANGCDSIITVQLRINQKVNALDDDLILPKDTTKTLIHVLQNDIYPANLFELKILQRPIIGTIQDLNNGTIKLEVPNAAKGTLIFTYQLCALNCVYECDSATVRIQIKGTGDDLDPISTGVTPNGDGKNDVLDLPEIDWNRYPESEIEIYNRWQQKVYAAKPYKRDWTGQSTEGVDLPTGDYFIILRLSKADGKIIIGNVYLAR